MRNTNFSMKSILLFSILVLLFSSCSKEDAVVTSPDYVGTWSATMTQDGIQVKDKMTFTKDGCTDIIQIYNSATNTWIDFMKTIGTISVTGSTMTTTYTGIGVATDLTGTITISAVGSSNFQSLITENGIPLTFNSKYSVTGNKMTIMTDTNGDGLYTGTNETTIYTKQ